MKRRLYSERIDLNKLITKGYYIIDPGSKLINGPDDKYKYKYIFVIVKSVDPITDEIDIIKQICMPADTSEVIFSREMYYLSDHKKFTEWKAIELKQIKSNYTEKNKDGKD